MPRSAAIRMSRPGRRVAGARGDGELADVLRPQAGVGECGADRVLAQRQRLGAVAAHPRPGRPARHVLGHRVHRGVPAGARRRRGTAVPSRGRHRSARRTGPPTCPPARRAGPGSAVPSPDHVGVARHGCRFPFVTPLNHPRPGGRADRRPGRARPWSGPAPSGPSRCGRASQRARSSRAGRIPRSCRSHAVSGALAAQHRRGRRTAPGRGCPAGARRVPARPARSRRSGPAPCRGQGVDHQQPAGPQQPACLGHGGGQVGDVFEDLPGRDHVGAAVGQRDGGDVGAHHGRRRARPPGRARWP